MSEEDPKLTRFEKMWRYLARNPAILVLTVVSGVIITAGGVIGAIPEIIDAIKSLGNGTTTRVSNSNESATIEDLPPAGGNTSSTDGEAVSRAGREPTQSVPSELHSGSRRKHVSPGTIGPGPTADTTPPETSIPARWVDIDPPPPNTRVGPRWTFVAMGRSEGGFLYPYVADAYGGRFVGSPLQSNGDGAWFGDAPIGDNETKSGTTYTVFVIWSAKSIPTNRAGALPLTAKIISRPATVTRR